MKRLTLVLFALVALAFSGFAQTADEIVARMEKEVARGEKEGVAMTMTMKIPLVGEIVTKMKVIGDDTRSVVKMKEEDMVIWTDKTTIRSYSSKSNEIVIENSKSDRSDNKEQDMFKGIATGYKTTITGETDATWSLKCVRTHDNPDKDDLKRMDIVVSKKTFLPVRLTAKASVATLIISDYSIGVTPEEVKFDASAYPGVKITDKR